MKPTDSEMSLVEKNTTASNEDKLSITVLPPKMQRFVQLYMTGQYTNAKLAQLLEVDPHTISNWMKRKDVQAIINDMAETTHMMVTTQLRALSQKAANKLDSLIDSPIDGVALNAVKDVLDRTGHKPKQEIKVDKTVRTFEERLTDLIDKTIDAEYTVEIPGDETE